MWRSWLDAAFGFALALLSMGGAHLFMNWAERRQRRRDNERSNNGE